MLQQPIWTILILGMFNSTDFLTEMFNTYKYLSPLKQVVFTLFLFPFALAEIVMVHDWALVSDN